MFIDVASGQFTRERANTGVSEEVLLEAAQHVEQRHAEMGARGPRFKPLPGCS